MIFCIDIIENRNMYIYLLICKNLIIFYIQNDNWKQKNRQSERYLIIVASFGSIFNQQN